MPSDKELQAKIQNWMDKQSADTLCCFQCKREPRYVYFPEDLSWDPVLICHECRDNFDVAVAFASGEIEGAMH